MNQQNKQIKAQGYGLNEEQQKAVAALWEW